VFLVFLVFLGLACRLVGHLALVLLVLVLVLVLETWVLRVRWALVVGGCVVVVE
jgi:hypothetical protein